MAKNSVTVEGLDEFEKAMEILGTHTASMCKRMVYAGANVTVSAVAGSLAAAVGPNATGDLAAALGVSKIRADADGANTLVGFDGYGGKNNTPLPLQANVLESGRSDQPGRKKTHFFSRAVKSSRAGAQNAMRAAFDSYINTVMEGK